LTGGKAAYLLAGFFNMSATPWTLTEKE